MKTKFLNVVLLAFLAGVFLIACNEELPLMDDQVVPNSEIEQTSFQVNVSSSKDYLTSMIESIKIAEDQGLIKPGQAKALIAQLNAAIINTNNGNTTAASKQLVALSVEIQGLAEAGQIPALIADDLSKKADGGAALTQGYFTDPVDNYKYPVVLIGDQIWMAENLRTTSFNDGTPITEISDYNEWSSPGYDNGLRTPAYCWYMNDYNLYGRAYGALYNFYAVNTGKLCPTGWHVPSSYDVYKLIIFIDPYASTSNGQNSAMYYPNGTYYMGRSVTAGAKLKESGNLHWSEGNATNEFGFSSLPGGYRWAGGDQGYLSLGNECHFWTTDYIVTGSFPGIPWSIFEWKMFNYPASWGENNSDQMELTLNFPVAVWIEKGWQGNSVRCIKD